MLGCWGEGMCVYMKKKQHYGASEDREDFAAGAGLPAIHATEGWMEHGPRKMAKSGRGGLGVETGDSQDEQSRRRAGETKKPRGACQGRYGNPWLWTQFGREVNV